MKEKESSNQSNGGFEKVINPMETVIDGNFEDISNLQHDIDDQLKSIFQEFGGDENDVTFKIIIKRVVLGKGELEHCFSCIPSELPVIDRINNEYGAGSYEIWIYKNGRILKRPKLTIAKKIGNSMMVNSSNGNIDQSLQLILQQQNDRFSAIERVLQDKNSTIDPMQMLTASMGMVKEMMSINNPPSSSSPMDMMATMMGGMMQMKELMESFDKTSPVQQNTEDSGDSFIGLAKAFAPAISEITKAALINSNDKQMQPINQTETGNDNKADTNNEDQENFQKAIDFLAAKAKEGKDPSLYAELVIDNYSKEELEKYLEVPNAIDQIAKYYPIIDTYKGWFKELFDNISILFEEDKKEEISKEEKTSETTENK